MAEEIATRLGEVYRIETPILRIAGVYGRYERETGVREILSAQAQVVAEAKAGRPTRLSRAGFGGWLYSRDAAEGLATLLDAPLDEAAPIFDLGGPEIFSVEAFCAALAPAFPGWSHAIDADAPTVRFQIPIDKPASDFERLAAATGFAPRFGMRAAVADYLAWLDETR
jgi:nucleoside-diphosphate-sugar epimerase